MPTAAKSAPPKPVMKKEEEWDSGAWDSGAWDDAAYGWDSGGWGGHAWDGMIADHWREATKAEESDDVAAGQKNDRKT